MMTWNKYITNLANEPKKVDLASAKDISKHEAKLKAIQKEMRDFEGFKKKAASEILQTIKWLNDLKAGVLKVGINYKDVKGLNEINDLYWKVNKEAKELNII